MPRKLRIVVPGAVYHVYARGNNRQAIVGDDEDYRVLERLVVRICKQFGWICWIYTLMPNHIHLCIEIPRANLSAGMHRLLFRWAQLFNERWGRSGHLWQGRFNDRILETEEDRERECAYIAANAVRADLAPSPEKWPYTGGLAATWRAPGQTRDVA